MRLVSALYSGCYPFSEMGLFDSCVTAKEPNFKFINGQDVLVIWGGGDIPPEYYNKGRSSMSWASPVPGTRDRIEWGLIKNAIENKVPIIGVCRGAQMACAAAGGYLIQHISGHAGASHVVRAKVNKGEFEYFPTNTIHHQMMVPAGTNHVVLCDMPKPISDVYWDEDRRVAMEQEPEYIHFTDINAHAIQWHPEGMRLESAANLYIKNKLEQTLYV